MKPTNHHSIERTSPKGPGMPFIGTCVLCGKADLPITAMREECENQRGLSQEQALIEAIGAPKSNWPDPTPEMLADPAFEKVWQAIKSWDINVPGAYGGYCGATGNHVRAILDALRR
jgi:hypothetical protein